MWLVGACTAHFLLPFSHKMDANLRFSLLTGGLHEYVRRKNKHQSEVDDVYSKFVPYKVLSELG